MGRKKLDWQELKNRGCKPVRWLARQAEQQAQESSKAAIDSYVAAFALGETTFSNRCKSGEIICREIDGKKFSWPENHYLTMCRDYAEQNVNSADTEKSWTLKISKRFLNYFKEGSKVVVDPVAANNIKLMCEAFLDPSAPMNYLRLLALLEFWAVKRTDGSLFRPNAELLNFHASDIKMQDRAVYALRAHEERV